MTDAHRAVAPATFRKRLERALARFRTSWRSRHAGLLGCGTTGLGGAAGVVLGLVAGGVAGWIAATRAAHA